MKRTTPSTKSGHPLVHLWTYTVLSEAGSKSMYCYNGDRFSPDTRQSHPLIGEGAPKRLQLQCSDSLVYSIIILSSDTPVVYVTIKVG